jgi:hypothetical protein
MQIERQELISTATRGIESAQISIALLAGVIGVDRARGVLDTLTGVRAVMDDFRFEKKENEP